MKENKGSEELKAFHNWSFNLTLRLAITKHNNRGQNCFLQSVEFLENLKVKKGAEEI